MFEIGKTFFFSASHRLGQLPKDHPCHNLHGHNYQVVLVLKSYTLDGNGFVIDFRDLEPFKQWLDEQFDHKHLNAVVDFPPTCELLAKYIFHTIRKTKEWVTFGSLLESVIVKETRKTWARYYI